MLRIDIKFYILEILGFVRLMCLYYCFHFCRRFLEYFYPQSFSQFATLSELVILRNGKLL